MTERLSITGIRPIADKGDWMGALRAAALHSDHITRMMTRRRDVMDQLTAEGPDAVLSKALADMRGAAEPDLAIDACMKMMRRAKEAAQLAISAADLSGDWPLDNVLRHLTDLADVSVQTALARAIQEGWASGWFEGKSDNQGMPGLFVLAMGKMGAGELNYSSDIDLILLFDLDLLPFKGLRVKEAMTRVARSLVKILDERTVDGYVFRTDLRLRPDPSSTSPAISTQFALGYYESVGQNWERMAHIKARVCAGDRAAGESYLSELSPYVWRRHLDYWAIADVHSIKRQIHAHGGHAELSSPEFDVKLGRGGIREIEFFAQVQQLILGGRMPALRAPRTKAALVAMADASVISKDAAGDLCVAYDFLRDVEHRVQMLNDEQTHKLPDVPSRREDVRVLAGYASADVFEADIGAVRRRVHGIYSDLFAAEERLSGEAGNLVFTGVDDDPGTVATLRRMGFSDPSRIIHVFQQ